MNKKIKKYIKKPYLIILYLINKGHFKWLKDEKYLKIKYKLVMNRTLDLENPKTFNEKLQWLKLYDRNPEYTKMVDKYEAKKYVANIIGEEYIIPTLGVYDKFDDIDFQTLPNQFVLKCTHDSGGLVICKDKKQFNIEEAKKKINKCLKTNYYYTGREWPYKNVKPRIIAEQYMEDENSKELIDYKFLCFNSKAKYVFTGTERFSKNGLKITFFDMNWNKMPFERHYPSSKQKIKKPKKFELMVELAEKLSNDIPFVRVDFYELNDIVYFGELTFYPGSGWEEFNPEEWDLKLGNMLELPKEKREEKNAK